MPRMIVDPARLEGDALRDWYLQTPDEIEARRSAAEDRRYQRFFGRPLIEPRYARATMVPQAAVAREEEVLWMVDGRGGYRAVRPRGDEIWSDMYEEPARPAHLPPNPAAPETAEFINIGNPENERLKREYIKKYGFWPKTPDGRDYDVSHLKAIADGGTNTLDNIEPMDPAEHVAKHKRDGDYRRWSLRRGIARAFGGTVEPPAHAARPRRGGTVTRGLGALEMVPTILGMLNGRLRTDSLDNFTADMFGYPSQEDMQARMRRGV